jgi:hypothetical protein
MNSSPDFRFASDKRFYVAHLATVKLSASGVKVRAMLQETYLQCFRHEMPRMGKLRYVQYLHLRCAGVINVEDISKDGMQEIHKHKCRTPFKEY